MNNLQTKQAQKRQPLALPMLSGKSLEEPQSEQAEEGVIAAILSHSELYHSVSSELCDGSKAFFYLRHTYIFDAMTELVNEGVTIDQVTLSEKMLANGTLKDVGGPAYFTRLVRDYRWNNYLDYVNIVNTTYKRRVLLQVADDLKIAAMDKNTNAQTAINTAYSRLDHVNDKSKTFTTISDGLAVHMDNAEKALNNPIKMGIPSGITVLDDKIDGFHKRRVYVIAARTHHGKTSFMLSCALNAGKQGLRVGIFNVADGNSQDVISRLAGMESGLKGHDITTGRLEPQGYSRYVEAATKVSKYQLFIESKKGMTLPELLVSARNMQYRYGLDMICIDYIQRIGIDTSKQGAPQNRVDQLSYISAQITKLAGEKFLNIPILIGAQLNRSSVGKAPIMSDIKGCGGIEEDSDVVIMPYRENMTQDSMEIIVDKNKVNGVTGIVDVKFNQLSTLISDLDW